jgi:hypothetical protein
MHKLQKEKKKFKNNINFFLTNYWTDYKTNTQIVKELKITQIFNKLLNKCTHCKGIKNNTNFYKNTETTNF